MEQTCHFGFLTVCLCAVYFCQPHCFFGNAHGMDIAFHRQSRLKFFLHNFNGQHKFHLVFSFVLIQTEFMNIVLYFLWKQVLNGHTSLCPGTDIRRRNSQCRHFHVMDSAGIFFLNFSDFLEHLIFLITGSGYCHKVAKGQQTFRFFPAHNLMDGIGTGDKI